jgi:SHS2 domain-containing protein
MSEDKKFEFPDITTSDSAFTAYGKDLNDVFCNAALALFETITNTREVEAKEKRKVEVNGYDLKSLMYSWLSELLFISSSEHFLFSKFEVDIKKEGENFLLNGECSGEKIDIKKHEIKTEVKAITYHKMEIKEEDNKWKAQVIVDL